MEKIGNMNYYTEYGAGFLRFSQWEKFPEINHAFSARTGGVSGGEFSSLNLSFGRGDSDENVRENYRLMCSAAGFDENTLVSSAQTHKTNLVKATKEMFGNGVFKEQCLKETDGLYTNEPGITLVTHYADCVPLFFFDKTKKCIALSHAGWRGTVAMMGKETVDTLVREFGCNKSDILCAIGPSISKVNYEVDDAVADKARLLPFSLEDVLFPKGQGKYLFDLWQCNKKVLISAGIPEENITVGGVCTYAHSDILFSHRKTGGKRGGMAAFMCLNY